MSAATANAKRRLIRGPGPGPNGSASPSRPSETRRSTRLVELDGVRGLAALSVVVYHWLLTDPAFNAGPPRGPLTSGMNWLTATPLHAFVSGPEMVLLFFVLSGMVLALPRLAGRSASYGRYLFTRALRLYPAAWVVTAIAALALLVEPAHPHGGFSTGWLANEFGARISPGDAFHYIALIIPFDPTRLDGVLWSLELELRASLLLPLLVWLACRCGPVVTFVSAIALIVYGTTASLTPASWVWTTVVIGCFLLGILLARHRDALNRGWAALPPLGRRLVGLGILLCFWLPIFGVNGRLATLPIGFLLPILGACALIVAAQGRGMRAWLGGRVPAWLGRISYSLYLVHCVVLKLIATLVPNGRSPILLAPAGIALSLVIATILQRTVEAPAIRLSKTAWTARTAPPATWRRRLSLRA